VGEEAPARLNRALEALVARKTDPAPPTENAASAWGGWLLPAGLAVFILGFGGVWQWQKGRPAQGETVQATPLSGAPTPGSSAAAPGDPAYAPDFTLREISDGPELKLSSLRGKVVLLDFWATWCGPCRMEIPHFVDLQKEYGAKGLQIVGVSMDQQGEAVVVPFAKKWNVNYKMAIDSTGEVARAYGGIRSIPTTILIGRDGKVITGYVGYNPREVFEKAIKEALAKG
jgi:thiol-disulfide isomerase/thioredoxin